MMKRGVFLFSICAVAALCFFSPVAAAQTPSPSVSRIETPYLLPQTIFVGDQGRLVVPLGRVYARVEPFVLEIPESAAGEASSATRLRYSRNSGLLIQEGVLEALPENPDLQIRRIELERRGGASRLLIDFIPYAPGVLSFPPLIFVPSAVNLDEAESPDSETLTLGGLEVHVASILTPSQMVLADPASPLSVPGTSLLVYGSLVIVLALFFLGIGCSLWGRHHFKELWERIRRRHLIRVMMKFLRHLRQDSCLEKNGNPAFFLSLLSGEFREFLSFFTGVNCRSFSAGEFHDLPLGYHEAGASAGIDPESECPPSPADSGGKWPLFLCGLFRTWDDLRFSGKGIKMSDLFSALKETEKFIIALDRAEREKSIFKSLRGSPGKNPGKNPGEKPVMPATLAAGGEGM